MVSPKTTDTKAEMAQGAAYAPEGHRLWEDRTLSPEERYQSYYDVARAKCEAIRDAGNRPGVTAAERHRISQDPEANFWVNQFRQVKGESPEAFCRRIEEGVVRDLLGKSFLGAEVWQSHGIDVGAVPRVPATVTEALLNAECPLHPGKKVKDTHLLVLVPKTVNGEPCSLGKLEELCEEREEACGKLIYDEETWPTKWRSQPWVFAPQAQSEWVLLPKNDPDPNRLARERHFRWKTITMQESVHKDHYPQYREVGVLELVTAELLHFLANKERCLNYYLRCKEPNACGGTVCVGYFTPRGLMLNVEVVGASGYQDVGRALAWKL